VARTRIAPEAELLCVDLESLPFGDDWFGGIWASDVLHALSRKVQTVRELDRVSRPDSWGAAIWLALKGTDHHQPARPLTLDGYRRLLPDDTTFLDGDAVLQQYLDGHAADRSDPGDLATSATAVALWDRTGEARDGRPFDGWPHARGELGVNTLFDDVGGGELALRLPTEEFTQEHHAVRRYTPATARRDDDEGELVERFVLLGHPDGYR
jgi:SAM-dependent methyltransferase